MNPVEILAVAFCCMPIKVGLDGLVGLVGMWDPPFPLMPEQASLSRSGVPLNDSPTGHSLWDLALISPGLARGLFSF